MVEQLEIEDFDTAKAIFEKLQDVPAERRKRILGWVAEGLGVVLQGAVPPTPMPAPGAPAPTPTNAPAPPAADIKTFVASKAPSGPKTRGRLRLTLQGDVSQRLAAARQDEAEVDLALADTAGVFHVDAACGEL
jgi:hypothetical protein